MSQTKEIDEEWRKVNIEADRCVYYVSNHGQVKSMSKKYGDNEKLLKPYLSGCGYYYVDIANRSQRLHSIVAKAFLEKQPSLTHTIDHIDRNIANNHISNLRWATKSEQRINSSKYRHDIIETDKKKRHNILTKESRIKNGYLEKMTCPCGKIFQQHRKVKHERTAYHKNHVNDNL